MKMRPAKARAFSDEQILRLHAAWRSGETLAALAREAGTTKTRLEILLGRVLPGGRVAPPGAGRGKCGRGAAPALGEPAAPSFAYSKRRRAR
jgi:hypothetical protein